MNENITPEDLIGKYILYDGENGATFAKAESFLVREKYTWIIVDDVRIRSGNVISKHPRAMLQFGKLISGKLRIIDPENMGDINDLNEEIFIEILGGDGNYTSAATLGVDILPVDKRFKGKFKRSKNINNFGLELN